MQNFAIYKIDMYFWHQNQINLSKIQIMNRRQFINRSAALLAAGSIVGYYGCSKLNKGSIGIQLYSVKDELPKDFEGTLKKLSAMGYSSVEPYGFNGDKFIERITMKDLSVMVKDMGMTISGTHTGSRMLPENINDPAWDIWKKIAAELKSGGGTWAIQASVPGGGSIDSLDNIKRVAAHFNRVGEVCKKGGVKFAFHNHTEVFAKINGEEILDLLIKNTDPNLVFFQLDLGHTVNGGGDCIRLIRTYPNRIPLWHASDFDKANKKYIEVGKGDVPYKALFDLPKSGGLKNLTVEQETGGDIFAACKTDFDYLKQFKWTKV